MPPREPDGFVEAGGGRLEYRRIDPAVVPVDGDRPTLVFLHEGLGCVALWKDFPERLARATGCGALVYSRAGYGRSSPVPLPRPLRYMHDEALSVLPDLLDRLELRDVVLVGHSDGASIALIHAGGGAAARIRGVIAAAPHVFNEDVSVASIARAADAYRDGDLRAKLQRLHGDNVDIAFWGWNRAWLDPGFRAWTIEEYLPSIRVPVMVIQGDDDEYGTAAQYEAIAVQSGGPVEVVTLDACGHSPHRDRPDATLAAMERFIRTLPPVHSGA